MEPAAAFRLQARACGELGSPLYEWLLGRIAEQLELDANRPAAARSPLAAVLAGHDDDPGPSALALRLAGSVHRLVLEGTARDLAAYYPSAGGRWEAEQAWPVFLATLRDHRDRLVELVRHPPQTNEVGRSSALLGGLLILVRRHGLPVRLFEIGASAGLNLRADHYRYVRADGSGWGPADSPVLLDPAWRGEPLPDGRVAISERLGCDLSPVDVSAEPGRLRLLSYVWPDQLARIERLRGACAVAEAAPVEVRQQDALSFLGEVAPQPGHLTVLWHSVMRQYLSPDDRARLDRRVAGLAEAAGPDRPFAHLMLEPLPRPVADPPPAERSNTGGSSQIGGPSAPGTGWGRGEGDREFLVVLQTWPGGERRVLGSAAPHGLPVVWE